MITNSSGGDLIARTGDELLWNGSASYDLSFTFAKGLVCQRSIQGSCTPVETLSMPRGARSITLVFVAPTPDPLPTPRPFVEYTVRATDANGAGVVVGGTGTNARPRIIHRAADQFGD
jgi:hypothetical protein